MPAAQAGHRAGRARRGNRFGADRHPLRDHGQRSQGDARAQLDRERRHRGRRLRRRRWSLSPADQPALAAIAFVAALYHLINHSLYKTLLFFGVGAVETQTGTRDMDRLGGLIRWMPLTALGFLVGTLSIAGLPPFNGFVSEWLTLQTMLRSAELVATEREARLRGVRRGARADRRAGGDLLRQAVRDELPRHAPARRRSGASREPGSGGARSDGDPCACCALRFGVLADLRDSRARPARRAQIAAASAARCPGPAVLRLRARARRRLPPAFVSRVPRPRRAGRDRRCCPDAVWWCCIAAAKPIRWCSPCPPRTCWRRSRACCF